MHSIKGSNSHWDVMTNINSTTDLSISRTIFVKFCPTIMHTEIVLNSIKNSFGKQDNKCMGDRNARPININIDF